MGLRVPDTKHDETVQGILDDLKAGTEDRKKEKWQHSYRIEVITPIFGGGVEKGTPDKKMPIRASAIRGQLRYWWRFLAKNRSIDPLSGEDLFKAERDIWGGMAEKGEGHASNVRIRVENVPNVSPKEFPEKCPKQYQNLRRYPGLAYALFPAREQRNPPKPARKLIWVDSDNKLTFDLLLCVPEENFLKVEQALRWWVTFGGIGARTRRGCGSIYCTNELEKLPPVTTEEAKDVGCELVFPKRDFPRDPVPTWNRAIDILYKFRQSPSIARNHGRNSRYGRSKWPEPDSIREITGMHFKGYHKGKPFTHEPEHKAIPAFPRAAFGLPIEFKFHPDDVDLNNKQKSDPDTKHLVPDSSEHNTDRLASPLILTAYPKDQQYVPAALLMKCEHLEKISLKFSDDDGSQRDEWQENWWEEKKAALVDPVIDNKGTDALTAFMTFFENGGKKP